MGKINNIQVIVQEECTAQYDKGGVQAVCDHVMAQRIAGNPMYDDVKYCYCKPCEIAQPCLNGVCLVCGEVNKPTGVKDPDGEMIHVGDIVEDAEEAERQSRLEVRYKLWIEIERIETDPLTGDEDYFDEELPVGIAYRNSLKEAQDLQEGIAGMYNEL